MSLKTLLIAAPICFMSIAVSAAPSTVTVKTGELAGLQFDASAGWVLSPGVLEALDVGRVQFQPYGVLNEYSVNNSQGFYESVQFVAPAASLTLDTPSMRYLGATATGGITMTAPVQRSVSSGGVLTVTDLSIDAVNKRVLATFIGSNGVGTQKDVHFLNYATLSGDTLLGQPGVYQNSLTGLTITTGAFDILVQGLGLLNLGRGALASIEDYGVIASTFSVTAVTPAIPEPSTYALMGLGLVGVAFAARRRQKSASIPR